MGAGGLGDSLAWRNSNASLSLSFPVPGLCLSEGKRNCFSMNLDVSFVDRYLKISDFEASNGRIIFNFESIWKESFVVWSMYCTICHVFGLGKLQKKSADVDGAPDEI